MTEVLLLLVAILLSLACGAFVAAEFSLTTVDRGRLERAAERGERGAPGALKAVRSLTFQLSGAQLGITVTNLVVGMLSEPSIAKLIAGPLEALGISRSAASSLALVLGTALSTVFLMVVGELVPKNWAISSPLAVAKRVGNAQRLFSSAFRPFITHLNNTANRVVRRMGLEPAEELASARGPKELAALARHSAKEGALEADTAELFVRTLNLADLTAENVMTPRVQVIALEVQATCEDVANATRATGLSRFPVYRGNLDSVVGTAHIKDVLAIPADRRTRTRVSELMREPLRPGDPHRRPAPRPAVRQAHHGRCHRRVRRHRGRGHAGGHRRGGRRRGAGRARPARDARPGRGGQRRRRPRAVLGRRFGAGGPARARGSQGARRTVRDAGRSPGDGAGPYPGRG